MEIKKIEDLIKPTLKDGQKLLSYNCERLLSSGENYGSVMLKLQFKLLNANGQEEVIEGVAKTCPPKGMLWEAFNIKTTFKKEIATYETIVPCLNEFGKEMGIDCLLNFFPKCIAARISLDNGTNEVDEDAVLLLENLIAAGYNMGDRYVGFDLDSAKLVLRDLATLHASIIAFKSAKPLEFKEKILPHMKYMVSHIDDEEVQKLVGVMMESVALNHKCVPHLSKVKALVEQMRMQKLNPSNIPDTVNAFATFSHNDFWLNNTMIKYENGKPVSNKMVDFQNFSYASMGNDVIFFIYSSVAVDVLEDHIDDLFKIYYQKFIKILTTLKCNIAPYTYQAVMEEFAAATKSEQFSHVLFMLFPIMMLKSNAKDLADMKGGDFAQDRRAFHDNFSNRAQFVLLDLVKRGWI